MLLYGVYYSKYMLIIYFVWCCGGYVSNKSREGTWIPCKTLGESIKEKYPFSLPFVLPFEEVGDLWEFSDLPLSSGIQFLNFLLLLWFFGGKTHLLFSLILGIFFFFENGYFSSNNAGMWSAMCLLSGNADKVPSTC